MTNTKCQFVVNHESQETRVAVLENGILQELHIQRADTVGLVGNIYRATVIRILPGLEAAFVDFGGHKNGFLSLADIDTPRLTNKANSGQEASPPTIKNLLHEGQNIIVQVIKDAIDAKGARVTMKVSIASRYLVFMPTGHAVKVSHLIKNGDERKRLKTQLRCMLEELDVAVKPYQGSFILRSDAADIDLQSLRSDLQFLLGTWSSVLLAKSQSKSPGSIYIDLPVTQRLIRDIAPQHLNEVIVDDQQICDEVYHFWSHYYGENPLTVTCVSHAPNVFTDYGIDDEINRALFRRLDLDDGGYVIFDEAEAMTTIDVNTGSHVGQHELEETVFQTNLNSISIITQQIRLRNLSGIIIIDFIDMQNQHHRQQVLSSLKKLMGNDPINAMISGFTELGLIQIRRKRRYNSLRQILMTDCSTCHGSGVLKSLDTVMLEIWRELSGAAKAFETNRLQLRASSEIINFVKASKVSISKALERQFNCTIEIVDEPSFVREKFDIVSI
ncbi:MAG: Rne/Rng family ribonuclease [Porticoccaceae bacterium]|nr:Rne/Rng family ribonuclease [Porticoccaceae bacterium]MDG1473994.1 Rne/Rng family ribonuclease [Porticoccaceae bacterium]